MTFGLFAAENLTAADGSVIPANGLLEILSVDENSHAVCNTDLPFGSFYFKELSTDEHYILSDEKYPFEFSYAGQDTTVVEIKANDGKPIENDLIYGEIHGLKKDEDGNALGGAVIGLFKADCTEFTRENAILTAVSREDGGFYFAGIPFGNWVVREIEAPTGFVLSDETFAVTVDKDGAVIEVEIQNTLIRGTVQLTKVDKDYPDNKLSGAEFSVYRDSNGNKELDADDELLGTLTETGIGVYEMADLLYGGYFVKEAKAPEGFYLDDNAYYFEITEDGKTVTVENEAGRGFVNAPQVGSLKIIKTSSDGKVEGFSFHVTGPNGYVGIFTTDKNGEIIIDDLRIGEYVVSEVSDVASSAYVLPADPGGSQWEICLDPADMGDRDYFLETVLHEYCHYLTLNHRQADYRGEPTVETYCEAGMVSREGSYLDDFCQQFWTGYLDDRLADLDSYNFFLRHEEDFVSSYASTDPSEDISESFAFFVLWDVPESEAVWAEKLRFFLDYPELTEFRRQVRENLGLEQPEQAA